MKLYEDTYSIFQLDLAPAHTATGTNTCFNDHSVTVLDRPANWPDLNLENWWSVVKCAGHQIQQSRWTEGLLREPGLPKNLSRATDWSCFEALVQEKGTSTRPSSVTQLSEYTGFYNVWTYLHYHSKFSLALSSHKIMTEIKSGRIFPFVLSLIWISLFELNLSIKLTF